MYKGHTIAQEGLLPLSHIKVTMHAIEQFVLRGAKPNEFKKLEARIKRNLIRAKEVRRTDATLCILNNNMKDARYYLKRGWIYVVVEDSLTTCYQAQLRHYRNLDGTPLNL